MGADFKSSRTLALAALAVAMAAALWAQSAPPSTTPPATLPTAQSTPPSGAPPVTPPTAQPAPGTTPVGGDSPAPAPSKKPAPGTVPVKGDTSATAVNPDKVIEPEAIPSKSSPAPSRTSTPSAIAISVPAASATGTRSTPKSRWASSPAACARPCSCRASMAFSFSPPGLGCGTRQTAPDPFHPDVRRVTSRPGAPTASSAASNEASNWRSWALGVPTRYRAARAQKLNVLLADHAAVQHPDALGLAVLSSITVMISSTVVTSLRLPAKPRRPAASPRD